MTHRVRWLKMWATARYSLGFSEEEFWGLSPGMWVALHKARIEEISIYDAMQARISTTIRSIAMTKSKQNLKESNFRLFKPPVLMAVNQSSLENKWMSFVSRHNSKLIDRN